MSWPRFNPRERNPGSHCTGGWVGPRASLDKEAGGKILSPVPGIEPEIYTTLNYPLKMQSPHFFKLLILRFLRFKLNMAS
jgi:hypothetical protein